MSVRVTGVDEARDLEAIPRFVAQALAREGAETEVATDGGVVVVLTPELEQALAIAEVATLRPLGEARAGETPCPLEGTAMSWCLDRALARGRRAAALLSTPRPKLERLRELAMQRVSALNGRLTPREARPARFEVLVLEFEYEAMSEERESGRVAVALEPRLEALSVPLADALLARLDEAEPLAPRLPPEDLARAARRAASVAQRLIAARTAPFRTRLAQRMAKERARLVEYHDRLFVEAQRRRGRAGTDAEAMRAKGEAVERQREHKLSELSARFAMTVHCAFASALEVAYEASVAELVVRRRARDIPLRLGWDPFLHDLLPVLCAGCGGPTFSVHACDDAGHLTCAACAAPCAGCGRVSCRMCFRRTCPKCGAQRGGADDAAECETRATPGPDRDDRA